MLSKRNSKQVNKENEAKSKDHNDFKSTFNSTDQPGRSTTKTDPDRKASETRRHDLELDKKVEIVKSKPSTNKAPKASAPPKVNKTINLGIKPSVSKPASAATKKTKDISDTKEKYDITEISWISSTINSASRLSKYAVTGGYEGIRGSPLWVIRYKLGNQILPGQYNVNKRVAFVSHSGKVVRITENSFDVLCVPPGRVKWIECPPSGTIPLEAIQAGKSDDGEKLYIGRARKNMSLFPGKVHPIKKTCSICTGEKEFENTTFEILCKKTSEI